MANTIQGVDEYGTYYYIDSDSSRDRLTQSQMDDNAKWIWNYVQSNYPTWTINAVAAMCGNFRHEGIMNPSQWEYGRGKSTEYGYGLGQWTPATKLLDWLSSKTPAIDRKWPGGQIDRIDYERVAKIQWYATSTYNMTFLSFLTSTLTPSYLASAWLYNWERPASPASTEQLRKDSADYYYALLEGSEPPPPPPPPPPPTPTGLRPMPFWMYHRGFKYE